MHNRDSFWKPSGSERVNESQKLDETAEKQFYPTFSSSLTKLSLKQFFFIRSEVWGLLLNMFSVNYEYSRRNGENLPLQTPFKLSKKPQTFCGIFFQFLESTRNFQCSETNMTFVCQIYLKLLTAKELLI